MIKTVYDIVEKNFLKVDVLDRVRSIQDIFQNQNIECFVVYEEKKLTGIVTKKELVGAHPNRIAADIISDKYACVDNNMYIWEIKELFDLNKKIDIILVKNEDNVEGYITRTTMNIELGKHVDLLTGLYKSDYMFYNAYNLVKSSRPVTVMFMDLNNFGHIDKKYGHINGDAVIKKVADLLNDNVDPDSYLCRYAGDEFAIVTTNSIEDSRILAEKITDSIREYHFPNDIPVSAAIGITGFKTQDKKIKNVSGLVDKLVNTASLASTKAKQNSDRCIFVQNVESDAIA